MAQRGERDQPPEVALHQRQARAVENADDSQRNQQGAAARACTGKRPMWKRSME